MSDELDPMTLEEGLKDRGVQFPYQTGAWGKQLAGDVQRQFVPQAGEHPEQTLFKTLQAMLAMTPGRSPGSPATVGSLGGARNVVKPEYYIGDKKDGTFSVAKFEGSKEPTAVYTVKPGDELHACDCWNFTKYGGKCIHQQMVEGFTTDKMLKNAADEPGHITPFQRPPGE